MPQGGARRPRSDRGTLSGTHAATLDAAKAMTLRDCAERYNAAHKAGWKNDKHAAQWPAPLTTYVYPSFGSLSPCRPSMSGSS